MRSSCTHLLATLAMALTSGCGPRASASQATAAATSAAAAAAAQDTVQAFNTAQVQTVLASIAGRENEPAGRVFQNVKLLADVPARTLVVIMNGGYARALGVTCTHCHVTGDYASDAKRPKRAAREMAVMHRSINQQLAQMNEITTPKKENRAISCVTCHRGMVDPRRSR
jgi:hypothetical protein